MKTFLEKVSSGETRGEDIEEHVQAWHESSAECSLAEYLGMSDDEYALWVERPSALDLIIRARLEGMRLEKIA